MFSRDKIEETKDNLTEKLADDVMENCLFLSSYIGGQYAGLAEQYSFKDFELDKLEVSIVKKIYSLIGATELVVERSPENKRAEAYKLLMRDNEDLNRLIVDAVKRDVKEHKDEWQESYYDETDKVAVGTYGYTFDEVLEKEKTINEFVQKYADGLEVADTREPYYTEPTPNELAMQFAGDKKEYTRRAIPPQRTIPQITMGPGGDILLEHILVDKVA